MPTNDIREPLQVFKFGGTSVGSAEALRTAARHVAAAAPGVAVVVSAMNGITDLLLGAARTAAGGNAAPAREAAATFRARHLELVEKVVTRRGTAAALQVALEESTRELLAMCESITILRELTVRTEDAVVARGERVLARIFAALLSERRVRTTYVDATELIFTERRAGRLWPDFDRSAAATTERLGSLRAAGSVVVIPGFIATGPDGEVVTLGRSGSDFSAAIMARSLRASSLTLFKEVDGLMTADPRSVAEARVIPQLHYREAAELAYYGATVLHPRTIAPLVEQGIPLRVRNTFNPGFEGTRIAADVAPGEYAVKALTSIPGQALLSVEGNGMMGVPGIAGRTFAALSSAGHSVSMISQSSSESSICFVVPGAEADHAVAALEAAFALELQTKLIEVIRAEKEIALVAVVGLGMRGTPGIAARTFTALSRERINVVAIAQGSSELNITIALREADAPAALRSLHREYQLERIRPLAHVQGRDASVTLLGFGQIARTLAAQITSQQRWFRDDLGLELRCVAAADRSGLTVSENGFDADQLRLMSQRKTGGGRLTTGRKRLTLPQLGEQMRQSLFVLPAHRSILVDLTADETAPLLREALEHRFHLVLANKKPLAIPQEEYDALFETARRHGGSIRYEATVGAGLPVLDTLKKLAEAGDRVDTILGCLSGTLGYVMTQLEDGATYSEAVRQAVALGYTEPDPREDLSGMDVARKALILARTLGRRLDMRDVRLEALFPPELDDADPERFVAGLAALDDPMAEKLAASRAQGEVLRYVARIGNEGITVGIESLPEASAMGRLRGTDNQVVLHTRRYSTNPLVVSGPGAGAEVTAAGVLNDIVAAATGAAS